MIEEVIPKLTSRHGGKSLVVNDVRYNRCSDCRMAWISRKEVRRWQLVGHMLSVEHIVTSLSCAAALGFVCLSFFVGSGGPLFHAGLFLLFALAYEIVLKTLIRKAGKVTSSRYNDS